MTDTTPPIEAQRFGRSQTPESPRPVHLPEPSTIPVLRNQMDPVFNDTATYNIPNDQSFSPYSTRNFNEASAEEQDAIQNFFRGAEPESSLSQDPPSYLVPHDQGPAFANIASSEPYPNSDITPSAGQSANPFSTYLSTSPETGTADNASSPAAILISSAVNEEASEAAHKPAEELSVAPDATSQKENGGVDYSSLLDTIAKSVSAAPAADPVTAPTTTTSESDHNVQPISSIPGLPPKPPTSQDTSAKIPNEPPQDVSHALALFPPSDTLTQDFHSQQQQSIVQDVSMQRQVNEAAPGIVTHMSFHPPNFSNQNPLPYINTASSQPIQMPVISSATERPWTPSTQAVYDKFLEDERRYVTEGIWDRFPNGSRLFVGNLPSEKVTKRDLFHIFHRHGRLAQISIKQAFGFVQFLEAADCHDALQAEQGVEIRGRKINLEISKPQKNTRGVGAGGNKQNARRRSRSPERRVSTDRFGGRPSLSDHREEPGRRREDFGSSKSPRPYRSRDDFRPGGPNASSPRDYLHQNGRPHSPAYATFPPPLPQPYDEDAALPLPRRNPSDVPDVQVLILDNSVAQNFINWVENGFRAKGLRAATIWLSQRLPLQAVVKRQILEGVQGVVKLIQHNHFTSKIPLQVFDRSAGVSNVNFNEYVDLDVQVAADIVLHARQKERGQIHQSPQSAYPITPNYNQPPQWSRPPLPHAPPQPYHQTPPQYQQPGPPQPPQPPQPQHPQYGYPQQQHYAQPPRQNSGQYPAPQQSPATPGSANSANLQQLLANLGQVSPQSQYQTPASATRQPDLGGLLSNIKAHQHNQSQPYNPNAPQQGYPAPPGQPGSGGGQQNNVQDIMQQLARYQR